MSSAPPLPVALRALFGAVTAVLLLAGLEGGLWLLGVPDPGLYAGDLRTVWWLRLDLDRRQPFPPAETTFRLQTNHLGLRGALPPPTGPWTLALGCSTTFGWGVEAEEAWPAVLADLLGEPVVNGGQPGWSSHQARLGAARFLDLHPTRVILGYIVRDAQGALAPDAASTPTPLWRRSHLARLLSGRLHSPAALVTPAGTQDWPAVRVPPAAYRENLQVLLAQVPPETEVWLLAFPQPEADLEPWRAVLRTLGPPVLEPTLSPELFFAADPVHLTAAGNRALARILAPSLGGAR